MSAALILLDGRNQTATNMLARDLDSSLQQISDESQRLFERAAEEARRRGHTQLSPARLLFAFTETEAPLFEAAMHDVDASGRAIVDRTRSYLDSTPRGEGRDVHLAEDTRLLCRLALHRANRVGRTRITPGDLFMALLDDDEGVPMAIFRQQQVDAESILSRFQVRAKEHEERQEQLEKRLQLPPTLAQFGVSLNLLARQDRIPELAGRDAEIQQLAEVLSHRERSNSVMLLGEPGVGKTAIVEGLASTMQFMRRARRSPKVSCPAAAVAETLP